MSKFNSKTPLREAPGWVLSVRVVVGGALAAFSAFHLLATNDAVQFQREKKSAAQEAAVKEA